MKKIISLITFSVLILFSNNSFSQDIQVNILQANDIYEIGTLNDGKSGGISRLATMENNLEREGYHVMTVLAGDFLSPSSMGLAKVNGTPLAGKQMVDVLNRAGVDLVTFGNHEFDLDEKTLLARIQESKFEWIVSNVEYWPGADSTKKKSFSRMENGREVPFAKYSIKEFYGSNAESFRIGFIGTILNDNDPPYTKILDPNLSVKSTYDSIRSFCDVVIALTHQTLEADRELAKMIPDLLLIIGGHEHVHSQTRVGTVLITKADANLRSVYLHVIHWDSKNKKAQMNNTLLTVGLDLEEDPVVKDAVNYWTNLAFTSMKADGLNPEEVVWQTKDTLDGREGSNRMRPTNLGTMISEAMAKAWPGAKMGLLNSGSIRVDEAMTGTITQYDVTRILPFGGEIVKVSMKGGLLIKVLNLGTNENLFGNGGFLQSFNVSKDEKGWKIGKDRIDEGKEYIFAATKYLMTREKAYVELWNQNKDQFRIESGTSPEQKDIRKALIKYFQEYTVDR